ncbi:MAG: family 10 glycosylhydrolase, partial [Eubacteriales bacterium]
MYDRKYPNGSPLQDHAIDASSPAEQILKAQPPLSDECASSGTAQAPHLDRQLADAVKNARRKRRRKTHSAVLVSLLTVLTFGVTGFFLFALIGGQFAGKPDAQAPSDTQDAVNILADTSAVSENEEMRGVWIASVININYPSRTGLSQAELMAELDDIVKNTKEAGLNTIFFQVRPTADALYPSALFPYSKYISGTQGAAPDGNFDSLAYLLEKAGEAGLRVHAWVNPFRVTMYASDEAELAPDHPAVVHPEYTVKYADGKTYFNPGLPEVRALVIAGVEELARNYPTLAGIHFDDYFYPYPQSGAEFDDSAAYELYGAGMDKADWRRANVNVLVEETYRAVKAINPDLEFGVSPFGIWANAGSDTPEPGSVSSGLEAYSSLYCDALAWAKGGYVDYLIPQIYWSFATSAAPFDNIARWWNAALDGTGVKLYIGHAAYKAADYAKNEIGIQVEFARTLLCYRGSVYYGYDDIKNNTAGLRDKLISLNASPIRYEEPSAAAASVHQPYNNYQSTAPTVTLVGTSDPRYPLTVNGTKVSRTKSGGFSYFSAISTGINVFTLEQNGSKTTHNIGYNNNRGAAASVQTLSKMEITDVVPATEAWLLTGDTLKISCVAPAGSTVVAKIGGMSVTLKPTLNTTTSVRYAKEIYSGSITPSALVAADEIASLGTLSITATLNGETATVQGGLIRQMGEKALVFAEVINDYSYLKTSPTSSFYDDYTPASAGMRDYVQGLTGSYYKLRFGGYISSSNVKIVDGVALNQNKILAVKVQVNGTDTLNNQNNFTDVTFTCLENAPVNAVASAGKIDVTFYNTDSSLLPLPEIAANPLVSSVSAAAKDETTVIYTICLKNELNAYGYNVVYENGSIVVRMNNPQSLNADPEKPLSGKTIVVDAGHGGSDSGALGCGSVNEAMLNLEIALYLRTELEALGAAVKMTRTEDVTVSLEERMAFLNDANPDLAISVHQNSIASSVDAQKVRGYLGLYGTEAGKLLAKSISSTVCEELNRYERPYAYQKLAVARNHRFPSTLCEMCFIS